MCNGIEEAIHRHQTCDRAPGVHPEFFSFKKANAFIEDQRQKNKQADKIPEKYHRGIVNGV